MSIDEYLDFSLAAEDVEKDAEGIQGFTVRVFSSPAGRSEPQPRTVPADLRRYLGRLERRKLDVDSIVGLGEALADLLLPEPVRALFVQSLDGLDAGQGLRVRLRLAPGLAGIPWEYMYVQRTGGEKDATGFLALDPRVSIVRQEVLPVPADLDRTPRPRRMLVALASPEQEGYDALDLARERAYIQQALEDVPAVELEFVEPATVQGVGDTLLHGADIFHFAGHGVFQQTGLGASLGSTVGEGNLVFVGEDQKPALIPADQIAVNLRGHGVQLVVLGACQTGRRDEENVWSGVVAALMEAQIPAAVAMQYQVWDEAAIAFSRSFYQALAAGLPLDQAVSAGRVAVFNLCHPLQEDERRGRYWRDWGVPVLYLRAGGDFVLPAIADAGLRETVAAGPRAVVEHRFDEIGPKGKYVGIEAGAIRGGRIESYLKVGRMSGTVTQVQAGEVTGGDISVTGEAGVVDGEWTGVRLDSLGGPPAPPEPGPVSPLAAAGSRCPACGEPVEPGARFCPSCGAEMPAGPRFCHQCGAEVPAGARYCPQCGAELA